MFMSAPADYVATLALRLAHEHGRRAEAYELAVKGLDFAEWHGVLPNTWPWFVRVFCSECNRLWDG
jgi:recombinational DNA repair protein (RecF pathway)